MENEKQSFNTLLSSLKLFVLDCDGVLTNSQVLFDAQGNETAFFSIRDEGGIKLLKKINIPTIIMSGRDSEYTKSFARKNNVNCYTAVQDKKKLLLEILIKDFPSIQLNQVAFMGDGLADIELMQSIGIPISVANAIEAVKQLAVYITHANGGNHAVREVCDLIISVKK